MQVAKHVTGDLKTFDDHDIGFQERTDGSGEFSQVYFLDDGTENRQTQSYWLEIIFAGVRWQDFYHGQNKQD